MRRRTLKKNGLWSMKLMVATGLALLIMVGLAGPSLAAMGTSTLTGDFLFYRMGRAVHGAPSTLGNADRGNFGVNDEYTIGIEALYFDGAGNTNSSYNNYKMNRELLDTPTDGNTLMTNYYTTTAETETGVLTGTYTVSRNGLFTGAYVFPNGTETYDAYISEDGNLVLYGRYEYDEAGDWANCEFGVGVKKGSGLDESLLNGQYSVAYLETCLSGDAPRNPSFGITEEHTLDANEATFDGLGGVNITMVQNNIERTIFEVDDKNQYTTTPSIDHNSADGQDYAVTPTGGLTITIDEGEGDLTQVHGQVSANGNVVIMANTDFDETGKSTVISFGLAIKRGTGFTEASLKGDYVVGMYDIRIHGEAPPSQGNFGVNDLMMVQRIRVTFDGAGHVKLASEEGEVNRELLDYTGDTSVTGMADQVTYNRYYTTGSEEDSLETGTYSVTDDGTLTLTINVPGGDPDTGTGLVSADGQAILIREIDSDGTTFVNGSVGFGAKVAKQNTSLPALPLLLDD